jgi:light-regulated signal transduction histidine kinase (bacteriophytochrome)
MPMNPLSAILFIIAALAILGLKSPRLARMCAVIIILVGILRLVSYLSGWDYGPDLLLFHQKLAAAARNPNRMAPNTALGFILLGVAIWSAAARDSPERKRADERIHILNQELTHRAADLEASSRELEAFSYSVSHDLRSPLRSIDGFSQTLLEDHAHALNDEAKDCLNRVRAAAQRMAQLIDDMLSLSRISRAELRHEQTDLADAARAVIAELQREEPDRNVEVVIPPTLAAWGDPRLLRIALDNLLGNAWKFTARADNPRIQIGQTQDQGQTVYFVRDNGAGFDMAYSGKLFGAFQRLHSITEFAGTGIGLATVQRIIHRHGGRIWAHAQVGQGATFLFTLPRDPSPYPRPPDRRGPP